MAEKKLSFTAEEIDSLLQQVKEGGGGGGPVSWNDIQDKPFGEGIVTLVDNQTIAINPESGDGMITPIVVLVGGQDYVVVYNGTEYRVTAVNVSDNGVSGVFMGNLSVMGVGEGNGEPFVIGYFGPPQSMTMILALDGSAEVILTIIGEGIKVLDAKYKPELTYFYTNANEVNADNIHYLYLDSAFTRKVTAAELLAAKGNIEVISDTVYVLGNEEIPIRYHTTPTTIIDYRNVGGFAVCGVAIPFEDLDVLGHSYYTAEFTGWPQ